MKIGEKLRAGGCLLRSSTAASLASSSLTCIGGELLLVGVVKTHHGLASEVKGVCGCEEREETDLETLWGGVLRTRKREEGRADETVALLERDLEDLEDLEIEMAQEKEANVREAAPVEKPAATPLLQQFKRPQPSAGDAFPDVDQVLSRKQMRGQMRRLHTVGLGR